MAGRRFELENKYDKQEDFFERIVKITAIKLEVII